MIVIRDKYMCSGCGACYASCPVEAINMQEDFEGFKYPKVDAAKCIQCNKCEIVCPILNFEIERLNKYNCISSYAFRSRSEERENSSSGGVFYELAKHWISNGGVVVGAAFDEIFQLSHIMVDSMSELKPLMGSKYLQSDTNDIYIKVRDALGNKIQILFFGMTCQIEGLISFLRKDYDNLYCVDLICMGIPSPKVWKEYLHTYFKIDDIQSINYKDKIKGWHTFSFTVYFKDKNQFTQMGFDNYYMECMFKGYSIRPSCFRCKFKCENKKADLTIADCWGCEDYVSELDDNKGLSMVIVHSENGSKLLDSLIEVGDTKEFGYENVLTYNSNYHSCTKTNKKRRLFYKMLWKHPKFTFKLFGLNPQKSVLGRIIRKIGM